MKERIFKSTSLREGWEEISTVVPWWFDTEGEGNEYVKQDTLGGGGVPIVWDDSTWTIEDIKACTGNNVCSAILAKNKKKILILVHRDLPNIIIHGNATKEVPWDAYTKEGLWSIKKHFPEYDLQTVIVNPKVKTLEKFGVLKSIIKKTIETMDLLKGEGNGSTGKESPKD